MYCKETLLHLPADVLNAPFTFLPELHISLDGLLQVQDRGVLYYNHSCNQGHKWEIHGGSHSHSLRWQEENREALSNLVWTEAQV